MAARLTRRLSGGLARAVRACSPEIPARAFVPIALTLALGATLVLPDVLDRGQRASPRFRPADRSLLEPRVVAHSRAVEERDFPRAASFFSKKRMADAMRTGYLGRLARIFRNARISVERPKVWFEWRETKLIGRGLAVLTVTAAEARAIRSCIETVWAWERRSPEGPEDWFIVAETIFVADELQRCGRGETTTFSPAEARGLRRFFVITSAVIVLSA